MGFVDWKAKEMKLILISLFLPLLAASIVSFVRGKLFFGLALAGIFTVAMVLIVFPEVSSMLAAQIGIGRGADLIFYLFLPVSLILNMALFARSQRQEKQIELLARALALSQVPKSHEG